jgi:hypothetical protein
MAFGPARAYWQSFKTRLPRRVPISVLTKITLEEKPTDNGTFLVPKFTRERELTIDDARPIIESRTAMTGEWTEQLATDDRAPVTEAAPDGPFADESPF